MFLYDPNKNREINHVSVDQGVIVRGTETCETLHQTVQSDRDFKGMAD